MELPLKNIRPALILFNYVNSLIETTNGLYDYTIEDVAEYKDADEVSIEEVFKVLDNVEITKENAPVLIATKNKKSYHF